MLNRRNHQPENKRLWLFCDGSTGMQGKSHHASPAQQSPPNVAALKHLRKRFAASSQCAAAAIARADDGTIVDWAWRGLPTMSNNEAEYAGLLLGLEMARKRRAHTVVCVLDSAVVVGQMEGRFAVNSKRLRQWHWKTCAVARTIPVVQFCLAPREWNRLADGLACQSSIPWNLLRQALEQQQGRLSPGAAGASNPKEVR